MFGLKSLKFYDGNFAFS